jgi:hypothetical protein
MLSTAWKAYNSNDSWLPFFLPLTIWIGCFLYCYLPSDKPRPTFVKWTAMLNFHNYFAMSLALLSIVINDDAIFNERIPILWSLGYFGVDLVDCLIRLDVEYSLHAIFCVVLGVSNYVSPVCRLLRMNSKAQLCELSSPFLYLSKSTRNPLHFALFALVFTLCRVVWVPIILYQAKIHMPWSDYRILAVVLFYCLNVFWWFKIIRILINGLRGKEVKED